MADRWQVLENAGMFNELEVAEFETKRQADDYVAGMYTPMEIEEMCIDITRNGSTEY